MAGVENFELYRSLKERDIFRRVKQTAIKKILSCFLSTCTFLIKKEEGDNMNWRFSAVRLIRH